MPATSAGNDQPTLSRPADLGYGMGKRAGDRKVIVSDQIMREINQMLTSEEIDGARQ
jgi:hypothetical protein